MPKLIAHFRQIMREHNQDESKITEVVNKKIDEFSKKITAARTTLGVHEHSTDAEIQSAGNEMA